MLRKIFRIDEERCNGCGMCANACHEGAIRLVDGKARLLREDYCDGLGNCLPVCPTGAITIEEREAAAFDEEAARKSVQEQAGKTPEAGGPGSRAHSIRRERPIVPKRNVCVQSELRQWPVQIKLVPEKASYFENAGLLVSADCAAYAYGNFHSEFMHGKITLIGCPKLDDVDYSEKLTSIIAQNNIKSVIVLRMEVPCCAGIENAVKTALKNAGKMIPRRVVRLSTDGEILNE
ncbi:MAG: 4Fe-4S binding protein [Synergistaceae bacterium]|nr:4Fe-4S binding protein [Synergistaceae bacterium]